MNTFYRWLPGGSSQFSYHEEHARSKILDAYPEAHFEKSEAALLAWSSRAAFEQGQQPIAEIVELA
jgi:hypothetical protein